MTDSKRTASRAAPRGDGEAAAAAEPATPEAPPNAVSPDAGASGLRTAGSGDAATRSRAGSVPALAEETSSTSRTAEGEPEGEAETATGGAPEPPADPDSEEPPRNPRRPVLAGAAIAGAVLVAVPLLLVAGTSDSSEKETVAADSAATALQDLGKGEKPGEFVPASPSPAKKSASPAPDRGSRPTQVPSAAPSKARSDNAKPSATPTPRASTRSKTSPERVVANSAPVSRSEKDASWGPNTRLCRGMSWTSHNERTQLRMQDDGNLVLYWDGDPVWAAQGALGHGDCAVLQDDGNFVLYDNDHNALWATGLDLHATSVQIQDDGNFCLYNRAGEPVWATGRRG